MTNNATSELNEQYFDKYVHVNGLRLHFTDWNPTGNETIVMLHGLNVQTHTWDPIAAKLAKNYRVICPDLRGHGDSDWAKDGYRLGTFVADLKELCRLLALDRPIVVGHSLGARIAIGYAGAHPDDISMLLLSDTGPEVPREAAMFARDIVGAAFESRGFKDEAAALAFFEEKHPEWQPVFRELHVRHQLRKNWAGKLVFKSDPDVFWITGGIGLKEIPHLWEMVAAIQCPTLIMWGKTSPFFDDALVERMTSSMKDAHVEQFDTGHYIPRERPDEFVAAVERFVKENQ